MIIKDILTKRRIAKLQLGSFVIILEKRIIEALYRLTSRDCLRWVPVNRNFDRDEMVNLNICRPSPEFPRAFFCINQMSVIFKLKIFEINCIIFIFLSSEMQHRSLPDKRNTFHKRIWSISQNLFTLLFTEKQINQNKPARFMKASM